jgi:hypothetical protein
MSRPSLGRRTLVPVVHGGEEDLLGSELVIGLVGDQLLEQHGQVCDAQGPEFLVVLAGERQPWLPCPPRR